MNIEKVIPKIFASKPKGSTALDSMRSKVVPPPKSIKLIHGVTHKKDFIYDEYFEKLAAENHQFEYVKVANDPKFDGQKGFVTDVLESMEVEGTNVYMCGPKPMIKATEQQLFKQKLTKENIFAESA